MGSNLKNGKNKNSSYSNYGEFGPRPKSEINEIKLKSYAPKDETNVNFSTKLKKRSSYKQASKEKTSQETAKSVAKTTVHVMTIGAIAAVPAVATAVSISIFKSFEINVLHEEISYNSYVYQYEIDGNDDEYLLYLDNKYTQFVQPLKNGTNQGSFNDLKDDSTYKIYITSADGKETYYENSITTAEGGTLDNVRFPAIYYETSLIFDVGLDYTEYIENSLENFVFSLYNAQNDEHLYSYNLEKTEYYQGLSTYPKVDFYVDILEKDCYYILSYTVGGKPKQLQSEAFTFKVYSDPVTEFYGFEAENEVDLETRELTIYMSYEQYTDPLHDATLTITDLFTSKQLVLDVPVIYQQDVILNKDYFTDEDLLNHKFSLQLDYFIGERICHEIYDEYYFIEKVKESNFYYVFSPFELGNTGTETDFLLPFHCDFIDELECYDQFTFTIEGGNLDEFQYPLQIFTDTKTREWQIATLSTLQIGESYLSSVDQLLGNTYQFKVYTDYTDPETHEIESQKLIYSQDISFTQSSRTDVYGLRIPNNEINSDMYGTAQPIYLNDAQTIANMKIIYQTVSGREYEATIPNDVLPMALTGEIGIAPSWFSEDENFDFEQLTADLIEGTAIGITYETVNGATNTMMTHTGFKYTTM